MAKNCSYCGKQLSFRNSFVWENKPICRSCLDNIEQGQKVQSETIKQEPSTEGMTGGEWVGAVFCTPYGLFKYFDWKREYPRKSKQVCIFYLIAIPISILIRILIEASSY